MSTVWTQRREEWVSDCIVSPKVFTQMVDRLGEFVVPYQGALETEIGQHHLHLYLLGLLSHLPRKNTEDIATWVDVERQIIQDFIGTVPWNHRPLITMLVGQGQAFQPVEATDAEAPTDCQGLRVQLFETLKALQAEMAQAEQAQPADEPHHPVVVGLAHWLPQVGAACEHPGTPEAELNQLLSEATDALAGLRELTLSEVAA